MSIRAAQAKDAGVLTKIAFESKAHWGYSPEFMEACREELQVSQDKIADGRFHFFVLEKHNRVIGFYALERLSEEEWELEALFVTPNSMSQGVGASLVGHAKDFATSHGVKKILIQGDPNATGFYENQMARQVGKRQSGSVPGRFLPLFEIVLIKL
ncbi:MAG: GNAT family N-acetyltransferase [Pseudomonadota bacterium]